MNVDILKCELARVSSLYVQRFIWGIECDVELLLERTYQIRNQIAILENRCSVPPLVLHNISININRIIKSTDINFCTNC